MDGTKSIIPVQVTQTDESTDLSAASADANLSSDSGQAEENHPFDLTAEESPSLDFEQTKACCLHLSRLFCPELPPRCSDLKRLKALKGRIDQARKLCLLLNRPWLENNHLIQKACDWYIADQRIYYRERHRMIDIAMDRNLFLERIVPFAGCIRRMKSFFIRQLDELETVIRTLEDRR